MQYNRKHRAEIAPRSLPTTQLSPLQADTFRLYGRYNAWLVVRGFFGSRTFRPIVTLRLCQFAHRHGMIGKFLLPFCRIFHKFNTHSAGMDLPWATQAGPGLALTHGWAMVVSSGVRIGANVTLFHGVTLGRRDRISPDGQRELEYPVLEDEVWVGPHATIVGGITIGRGSRIGAGAFVTDDIPSYSFVTGNPAAVTRRQCTPDVYNRAPIDDCTE